jgi:glucosylceramidase
VAAKFLRGNVMARAAAAVGALLAAATNLPTAMINAVMALGTPPMGWEDFDSHVNGQYNETFALKAAAVQAQQLLPSGYDVFIMGGWSAGNLTVPGSGGVSEPDRTCTLILDEYGLPNAARFPSAAIDASPSACTELGLPGGRSYAATDIWTGELTPAACVAGFSTRLGARSLLLVHAAGSGHGAGSGPRNSPTRASSVIKSDDSAGSGPPAVAAGAAYNATPVSGIVYAQGLIFANTSAQRVINITLDAWLPSQLPGGPAVPATRRPALMFVHGGGFSGSILDKDKAALITPDVLYFVQRGFVGFQLNYRLGEDNASWPETWPRQERTGGAALGLLPSIAAGEVLSESQRFRFLPRGAGTGSRLSLASDTELCVVAQGAGGSVSMKPCPAATDMATSNSSTTYLWRLGDDGSIVGVGGPLDQQCLGTRAPSGGGLDKRAYVAAMARACNSSAYAQRWKATDLASSTGGQICHPTPSSAADGVANGRPPAVDSGCLSFSGGFNPPVAHLYPAVRDAKAAVRWLRAEGASRFHVNPDHVTLAGGSAGACTILGAGIAQLPGDFTAEIPAATDPTIASTHLEESSAVRSMIVHWGAPFAVDTATAADPLHRSRYEQAAAAGSLPSIIAYNGLVDTTIPIEHILEVQRAYEVVNGTIVVRPLPGDPHACWNATVVRPVDGKQQPMTMPEDAFEFIQRVQRLPSVDHGTSSAALKLDDVSSRLNDEGSAAPFSSIIQSSETAQLVEVGPIVWQPASKPAEEDAAVIMVELDVTTRRQTIFGFGGAFTEAAGYTFAQLSPAGREKVLSHYFDAEHGIGYTSGRIAMNSPDFALSHYSYANTTGDTNLTNFQHDLPRDNEYVLPLLRAALNRTEQPLRLFSAPWSPPAWFKVPFSPGGKGTMDVCRPDSLLPELRETWAKYFSLWHSAMAAQLGTPLWGFSAQNEPLAHGHMWDCCGYTLSNYTAFVSQHLMPRMKADHPAVKFLAFDHNPDAIEAWVNATYDDPVVKAWAWGSAVHWYSAPEQRGVALNHTHLNHPTKPILHTEGCVCRTMPFKNESNWWGVGESYGVGLVQYLQNWAAGFTDWNLLLDASGGPSHDRGFGCNAPLMLDPGSEDGVAVQAPYYFMCHMSRYLPPNTTIVGAMAYVAAAAPAPRGSFYYAKGAELGTQQLAVLGAVQPNGSNVAIVMNRQNQSLSYSLKDPRAGAGVSVKIVIPPHSIQTLRWDLTHAQQLELGAKADALKTDDLQATTWDQLTFGDTASEQQHGLSAVRSSVVTSPQAHRLLELNSSLTFAMLVDLDAEAQFLSIRFSGSQWKNASDIQALWLLDPETMHPWPNTAPGGAPPAGAETSMGSGGPLTHFDLVWGDTAPFADGWQLMSSVLPPGLVARARAAGHRGSTKLNFTVGAIIWQDLYGHTLRKPSRDVFEAFTSDDAFVLLPDLPPPGEETASSHANAAASAYTQHFLEPTAAQKRNPSKSLPKGGEVACESACNALACCQGFTRNPTTSDATAPGDGSCALYCGLIALTASRTEHFKGVRYRTVWLQKAGIPLPPVVGPPPPPPLPPACPPNCLGDEEYLQSQAIDEIISARASQNFGNASYALPGWAVGSVGGGACRKHGAACNETAWKAALAVEVKSRGTFPAHAVELIARAAASRQAWLPSDLTEDWAARSIAATDYWVRAQGANGGWLKTGGWPTGATGPQWIGGPHRVNATSSFEGSVTVAIGKTFLLLAKAGQLTEAVLAGPIDDDSDASTPKVTRRAAYEAMFERGVHFWLDTRGVPMSAEPPLPAYHNWGGPGNQALDSMHSLYLQWLSLSWLQPAVDDPAGLTSNAAKNLLMQGVGLALSEQKGAHGSTCASVTPAGLSVEGATGLNHGGYMEGYGEMAGHHFMVSRDVCEHDPLGCDPALITQAKHLQHTFARFRYVRRCSGCDGAPDYDCLIAEPHISWRHLLNPGVVTYGDFAVGAAVFGDTTSQRLFELFTEHEIIRRTQFNASFNCERSPRAPLNQVFDLASLYSTLKTRPPAPPLPTEPPPPGSPTRGSAWVDPVSQTIIVKDQLRGKAVTLSASMHWRSYTVAPAGSTRCSAEVLCHPILSNVTRLHFSMENSTVDRVATIPAIADAPDGLYTSRYGDYFIGICGYRCLPPHNVLTVPQPWHGSAVLELVSGRGYTEMVGKLHLAPLEAVVLKAHPEAG